ncbi:hypothetical protein HF086_014060 [Spodoptera exigua]|uniref:Exocyst complex component Sec10-like alpha-helical bundle domain-containing protein n=1 Tax=Spodoptera exigua TaxID=7107 RepID=A0A922SIR0_SPOEX|nr:hypothetical protein HF086_014060 [Spodoptera exigua]
MMNQYIKELEQDPFDPDEFVERMVRRSMQESRLQDDQFDPEMIHDIFTQAIQDLKVLQERQERKCARLEQAVQEEEKLYGAKLAEIMDQHTLNEAADVIQKLHTIAQELPPDKFEVAKKKIEAKYDEIERNLIEEFVKAQNQGNMSKMKEIANIMTNFKGYSQCVDAYIETSQMNTLLGKDIFSAVLPLCKKNYTIISNVFPNPDQVMSKFVLNIFHLKLQKYIQTKLADKNDVEKYLRNLYDMYTSTQRVCEELVLAGLVSAEGNSATGDLRRDALINGAMAGANDGYASLEIRRLKAAMSNALNTYYTEKQHVKKPIQGGGFQELRREFQARTNINIAQIENYGGETFLSEQLVQKMINDAKTSFTRCKTIYFFDIVKQANKIVRMFEEHYQESVLTCITSATKQNDCMQRKTAIMDQLENKLDVGLDRSITAIACLAVVNYLNNVMDKIHGGLEGENLHAVTLDLAVRLHRVIYEHLQNYQFNSAGKLF